jgi:hypothetical protein
VFGESGVFGVFGESGVFGVFGEFGEFGDSVLSAESNGDSAGLSADSGESSVVRSTCSTGVGSLRSCRSNPSVATAAVPTPSTAAAAPAPIATFQGLLRRIIFSLRLRAVWWARSTSLPLRNKPHLSRR